MHDVSLKAYGQLTPKERINLTISALAREDFTEADRLYDSCPKRDYTVCDKEYNCRLMSLPSIKYLFYTKCVYYYNILVKIDHIILLLEATSLTTPHEEDSKYDKMLVRHRIFVGRLKALHQGFLQFCDQAELDGHDLLKTIDVQGTCFDIIKYLTYNVAPDQPDIDAIKAMFLECWQF